MVLSRFVRRLESRFLIAGSAIAFSLAVVGLPLSASAQKVSESDAPILNDSDEFQFAIMGDRTGGMRPGVFEIAVQKVNLLQPEFVLSVGDLIDGYTTDPAVWTAQYEEFDAIIEGLEMKFYHVPGNHDISNPELDQEWRKRRGSPWYSFVYKNVLFISLHTEDRKGGGIGEQQIQDIRDALDQHQDVRWTLLFMHRPLWSYGDQAGYEEIEAALGDRPYTLFSGHHHHYLYSEHNGRDHYVLATSGGGSYLRGVDFGEFDHVTWVTMKKDGPVVAHLELDGIHDKNIVTDQNNALIQALRQGSWMSTSPVVAESESVELIETVITFSNGEQAPMRVFGDLGGDAGHGNVGHGNVGLGNAGLGNAGGTSTVEFYPTSVDLTVPPGGVVELPIRLRASSGGNLSIDALNQEGLAIQLNAEYEIPAASEPDGVKRLSLPANASFQLDWEHELKVSDASVQVDGDVSEWRAAEWLAIDRPVFAHEDWDWNGIEDGKFQFAVRLTDDSLYVGIQAEDDRLILSDTDVLEERQDQFFIHLNRNTGIGGTASLPYRLYNQMAVDPETFLQITMGSVATGETVVSTNDPKVMVFGKKQITTSGGKSVLTAEVAISRAYFESELQGPEDLSFRLNVGWMDHDRPENTKPSTLWWRPGWGFSSDFEGVSIFQVKQ